MDTMETFTYSF